MRCRPPVRKHAHPFFENGIVSINLPISDQVVGARATRTTHPLALERFRQFLGAAIGQPFEVDNPFIWSTKADVIRSIVDRGYGAHAALVARQMGKPCIVGSAARLQFTMSFLFYNRKHWQHCYTTYCCGRMNF